MTSQWRLHSIIGPLYLVASGVGLQGVYWKAKDIALAESLEEDRPDVRILKSAVEQIESYLRGERRGFQLPYDVSGTAFQKQVWGILSAIPYGQTLSYAEVAKRIANPKAVRAVGSANGRNPLSIIVPCHRVIAADGTLGGYAGGLNIKMRLLELEQK